MNNRILQYDPFDFWTQPEISWVDLCKDKMFTAFFECYESLNPEYGSLHVVLSDGNISDSSIESCYEYAVEQGDIVGAYLASQLIRVPYEERVVYDFIFV